MAGAGTAGGKGSGVGKLESQIYCIKYTLFCFNVILWVSVLQGAIFSTKFALSYLNCCSNSASRLEKYSPKERDSVWQSMS